MTMASAHIVIIVLVFLVYRLFYGQMMPVR